MRVAEYDLEMTKRIMEKHNKQEEESEGAENKINFSDIMLKTIKLGLLPRSS